MQTLLPHGKPPRFQPPWLPPLQAAEKNARFGNFCVVLCAVPGDPCIRDTELQAIQTSSGTHCHTPDFQRKPFVADPYQSIAELPGLVKVKNYFISPLSLALCWKRRSNTEQAETIQALAQEAE